MTSTIKKFSLFGISLAVFALCGLGAAPSLAVSTSSQPTEADPILPTALDLPIPYTSQAPTGNWDYVHNESCEEASALMAYLYTTGKIYPVIPVQIAEKEMAALNAWEKKQFGYFDDTNNAQMAQMIKDVYHLGTFVLKNFTETDLKKELLGQHAIILSIDGKRLHNPHFRQPGPAHHVVVIRGYNKNGFITNEPGTRYGNGYVYSFKTLYNAAGNWNRSRKAVDVTIKEALVITKK